MQRNPLESRRRRSAAARRRPWPPAAAAGLSLLALAALARPCPAQDATEERLKKLEAEFEAYKKASDQERAAMKGELEALRAKLEKTQTAPAPGAVDDAISDLQARLAAMQQKQSSLEASRGQRVAYLDISFDLLTVAGTSQATDAQLPIVEPGGHDPKQRGFTVQNAELFLEGAVDPNFRGAANIVLQIDPQGDSTIELEEAYLYTTSLPIDLQLKVGQFFTEFGRINSQHPHQWDFVDQPLVSNRMFGADGLRGPGALVSWLVPTDFFLEAQAGILNARGETQTSFIGNADTNPPITGSGGGPIPAALGGHPFVYDETKNLGDMLYTGRLKSSFDLDDESTIVPGASGAFGPNATGAHGNTQIYGLDAFYKWKPLANDQGWPFVMATTEYQWRRYHAAAFDGDLDGDGTNETFRAQTFNDSGLYAQLVYGFARPWAAGARLDWVNGDGASTGGDGTLDRRLRYSADLTFYPSEFSKIRLQANLDRVEQLGDQHFFSIWLQFEILFGAHGAHKF